MGEQQQQSTLGKAMYVESLMTREEWGRRMKAYPSPSNKRWDEVNLHTPNSFKWRFGMGSTLSSAEIGNINANLDYLLQKVKYDEE